VTASAAPPAADADSPPASPAAAEPEQPGVRGFLQAHLAKGVQMVPKIKLSKEKAEDGSSA